MTGRQLLWMRQGKSSHDASHLLRNKAKRRAQRMGVWIARHNLQPDAVITHCHPCAITTAEKTLKTMGQSVHDMVVTEHPMDALCDLSNQYHRVLLVGDWQQHPLRHGDLLVMDKDEVVQHRVFAKQLLKEFPFPDIHSSELRVRPAYYYRQSSVIPYRICEKNMEIMLITSSSGRHWIVPKGICEPGMSAIDSAAKEAREEAGIEGVVNTAILGNYHYLKWKSTCQVEVFAMRVTREMDENEWEESHRVRRWCHPDEAMSLLHQQALLPLITHLVNDPRSFG